MCFLFDNNEILYQRFFIIIKYYVKCSMNESLVLIILPYSLIMECMVMIVRKGIGSKKGEGAF